MYYLYRWILGLQEGRELCPRRTGGGGGRLAGWYAGDVGSPVPRGGAAATSNPTGVAWKEMYLYICMNTGCYKNILPNIELLPTPTYSKELNL